MLLIALMQRAHIIIFMQTKVAVAALMLLSQTFCKIFPEAFFCFTFFNKFQYQKTSSFIFAIQKRLRNF